MSDIVSALPKKNVISHYSIDNMEIDIQWSFFPLLGTNKTIEGLILVGNDITEHKKQEKELRHLKITLEELDLLKNVVKYAPDMIYWKDKNSIHLGCNDQFAIAAGYSNSEDVVGKSDYDFPWKDQAEKYNLDDKEVIESGEPRLNIEDQMPFKNGKKAVVITNKVPLRNSRGTVVGVLGIATDISDRKNMEEDLKLSKEQAEAASHAKTEFIANMSHDIRTPLTGVIGMSEILEINLIDPQQKEEAHIIHDGGQELLLMLNGILDDIRAGNINEGNIHKEAFDLYDCINNLIKLERPTTTAKNLGLFVEIDQNVPRKIINDRKKIHRILLNLLGNAIKFTSSGHITIEVKCLKKSSNDVQLRFCVIDTGIGIPIDKQDQVFDRFFRVSPSYKGIYKGHGLGLHIAQNYAKLLGGRIALTSEEDVGSTFYFDIHSQLADDSLEIKPFETPTVEIPSPTQFHIKTPRNKSNKLPLTTPHFLLIEDNMMALKALQSTISQAGCRYQSVMNAEDAFDLIKSNSFDLILTDIGLPGISGTELSTQIRKWEKEHDKKQQPIIGLSGHARESILDECLKAGMDDIFTKPASLDLIQELIKTHLSNKPSKPNEDNQPCSKTTGRLGIGIPTLEEELFQLEQYPLFDPNMAYEVIGDDLAFLINMLKIFLSNESQKDIKNMKKAYKDKDWRKIAELALKIKSATYYIGTYRLLYACQYLERYYDANHHSLLEKLYIQLQDVYDETCKNIEAWLLKSK